MHVVPIPLLILAIRATVGRGSSGKRMWVGWLTKTLAFPECNTETVCASVPKKIFY